MGNTKKPPRPRRTRPDVEIAFIPGATINTDEAVAAMQQKTHDGLIEMLGPRRRSGIRWRHVHGRAEAERFLSDMYGDRPDLTWGIDQYRAFLAEHGDEAVLIVAECEAVR